MSALQILLQVLTAANQSTPLIESLVAFIENKQAAGVPDDQILAEAMALAMETEQLTAVDEGPTP